MNLLTMSYATAPWTHGRRTTGTPEMALHIFVRTPRH